VKYAVPLIITEKLIKFAKGQYQNVEIIGIDDVSWIMEVVCFVIGLSIAGQTFYMFILENLFLFGTLKAIGSKKNDLINIIFF